MTRTAVDLSEFEAISPGTGGVRCWGENLAPEHLAKLKAARKEGHSYATLASGAQRWGYGRANDAGMAKHLKGKCRCSK